MTDEQIIIDGCDVSECLFYQSNFEEDYDVKIKHFCSNWHNSCESANNSNCYFKQLARKTQECEKYEQALDEIYLIIDEIKEQYDIWEISELEQIQDIINKAKEKICYWDKSIDMSKATLQVDGEIICKFDNDNQTVILVNDNYLNKAKDGE